MSAPPALPVRFLFAGSDASAERAAVAYTLLGCYALVEVKPSARADGHA